MQFDTTQVYDPGKPRRVIDDDLLRFAARRERQRNGSQPIRPLFGCAFPIKCLCFGAVDETLENQRTISDSSESARRNRQIVAYKIEFREPGLPGEIRLVGVGYRDFASLDRQNLCGDFLLHKKQANIPSLNLSLLSCRDKPLRIGNLGPGPSCRMLEVGKGGLPPLTQELKSPRAGVTHLS